jgi:hypothetical protein
MSMNRTGSRSSPLLLALLLLGVAACAAVGTTMSVSVGFGAPAPWGAATIGTSVPMGYGW